MTVSEQSWPASRIVHLAGGCRAVNNSNPGPTVELHPITKNKQLRLTLRRYGAIYRSLESLGLNVIGVDFYTHRSQIDESTPPDWRPFHGSLISPWLWDQTEIKWSHISHNAHEKKNGRLWDLSRRISHQMRVCSWRLRQVSEAYHAELFAQIGVRGFDKRKVFDDGFTWLGYLSIQSFLVDACILRDYLAEFAARYVYTPRPESTKPAISSMASLKKHILDRCADTDAMTKFLKEATEDSGWLKEVGDYRDLVIHSAPLAGAEQRLFAILDASEIPHSEELLPFVKFPIPENPKEILKSRSTGSMFNDFTLQLEAFRKAATGHMPNKDGLLYAHDTLGRFCTLSAMLSDKSPLPPKMMVFDKSNIIGEVTIVNSKT